MTCIIRWSLLNDISIYYSKTISVSLQSTVKERPDILQAELNRFLSISSPWFELFTEAFPRRNCPRTLRHCFASGVVAIENSWRASFELLFQHFISITGSRRGDDSVEEEKLLKGPQEYNWTEIYSSKWFAIASILQKRGYYHPRPQTCSLFHLTVCGRPIDSLIGSKAPSAWPQARVWVSKNICEVNVPIYYLWLHCTISLQCTKKICVANVSM